MSYGAPTYSPREGIDFAIVSEAFALLGQHWKVYATAGVVALLAALPGQLIGVLPVFADAGLIESSAWTSESVALLTYPLSFMAYVFDALMAVGVTLFTLNVIRGLPASPSDIWAGFRDPLGYIWLMILSGIVGLLGLIGCIIGVFVTMGLMMCVYAIKVDRNVTASDAVVQSWHMLKGEWAMAAVFFFVVSLISALGLLACCVGYAFTFSFQYIAAAILYNGYVGYVPQQSQQSVSPYPRPGQPGYGTPPTQPQEETPRPPMDDSPHRE